MSEPGVKSNALYTARVEAMAAALHEDCRLEWQAIGVVDPGRMVTMHGADAHYGKAHDLVRRLWTNDGHGLEAAALAGPGADRLAEALRTASDRVAIALQTSRHKLVRAAPGGVACICGQYDDSDHGVEAAELWRDHLIAVARTAVLGEES